MDPAKEGGDDKVLQDRKINHSPVTLFSLKATEEKAVREATGKGNR